MSPALAAGLQIAFVLVVLAIAYVPVGDYMARVYSSTRDLRVESVIYRVGRIDSRASRRGTLRRKRSRILAGQRIVPVLPATDSGSTAAE